MAPSSVSGSAPATSQTSTFGYSSRYLTPMLASVCFSREVRRFHKIYILNATIINLKPAVISNTERTTGMPFVVFSSSADTKEFPQTYFTSLR